MAYKSRGNYPVKVDICKKCHRVREYCSCEKEFKCPEGKFICNVGYACDACPYNEDLKKEKK